MNLDRNKGAATIIVRRIRGGDDADSMRRSNEEFTPFPRSEDGGADLEMEPGLGAATEEVMEAMERKDAKALKRALFSFVEMAQIVMHKK